MTEEHTSSTHPILPPTTEADRVAWLCLLRSRRVGTRTFFRLIQEHGSAPAALAALPDVARAAGVTDYVACSAETAKAELAEGRASGARLVAFNDPFYPALLSELSDAPPLFWARGNLDLLQQPILSLVGARNASSLGTRMARALARDLGRQGFVIASGLARGIDAAAHIAALPHGTLAVFAGGLDVIYPTEHAALAHDIAKSGLCISEHPPATTPQARHFPTRNRIVSGLSRAVIVVEAAAKSGSLITARNALDQGRDVLVVPGHPFDARASGCNMLIRDGATLVRSAEDVLEALGSLSGDMPQQATLPNLLSEAAPPKTKRSLRDVSKLHMMILDRLGPSPLSEDQLIRDTGQDAQTVTPALVDLELDGKVIRHSGGLLSRK